MSSALTMEKPERKIVEKNRRNQMKLLYSRLFSLIPPHIISKEGDHVADRVDRTIDYIQTLKTSLEMNQNKKDKLLSKKRSHEHMEMINNLGISLDIQIHEMTHDHDAVLVTGLKTHSSFCNVVRFLDQYSTEVTLASFSSSGHSTFHIRQKKIGADDICERLKKLVENKELGDNNTNALFCNELADLDLSVWDFDIQY
ncbi:putative transcription factor bHLH family [Helianthus anomalus]